MIVWFYINERSKRRGTTTRSLNKMKQAKKNVFAKKNGSKKMLDEKQTLGLKKKNWLEKPFGKKQALLLLGYLR